jgi:hypothetical protein
VEFKISKGMTKIEHHQQFLCGGNMCSAAKEFVFSNSTSSLLRSISATAKLLVLYFGHGLSPPQFCAASAQNCGSLWNYPTIGP